MKIIVDKINTTLYIFIYMILGIAFLSAIYDLKWLLLLDKPSVKIIYGLYLGWLGFFSFRLTRGFIENDIISTLFPIESIISITWGITEYFEFVPRSTFFSTSSGATALLISLFIPYYYGNIHRSVFGGWKEKRIEQKNKLS
jgi:hypothetical protein